MANKQIRIEDSDNGREYVLEFDRSIVLQLDKDGFDIQNANKHPVSTMTDLFKAAFLKNHPNTKENDILDVLKNIDDKEGLFKALAEMYAEPLESLFGKSKNSKNLQWHVK